MRPATPEAYKLLHDGSIALSEMEHNGMRVDEEYLSRAMAKNQRRIDHAERKLKGGKVFALWRKTFGDKTKLSSGPQLATIIYDKLGFECKDVTESGKPKVDEEAFEDIDHPFVKSYVAWKKELKSRDFLRGIKREVVDGYLRPIQNLNIARTYRSSSDRPNAHNWPIRNPEMSKLIRSCFIPRHPKNVLVETDFSGIEVKVSACYHKDPVMIEYINDKTKDMHRDMAMQCFKLKRQQVSKLARYCGKNMFVFPQFYGDYYLNNAVAMWNAIGRMKLTVEGADTPLYDHLRSKGIRDRGACKPGTDPVKGTFEYHMREVQRDFWGRRFGVYSKWKEEWWQKYQKRGYMRTLTGFLLQGIHSRNEIINYPIQGSAFHCLLWSLVELTNELRKRKMRSKVICQIHDSILGDVPRNELDDYVALAKEIMTQRLVKHWDWICVPLEIEAEVSPLGMSWFDKKGIEI